MDTDDVELPKTPKTAATLETMSIEALTDYVSDLEAEIVRVRALIADKQEARGSAEGLFRK